MSEKVLEKKLKRYVLACISDNYCWYLKSTRTPREDSWIAHTSYGMTTDIEQADKFVARSIANTIREDYLRLSNDQVDLVPIPLEIEYALIKEI